MNLKSFFGEAQGVLFLIVVLGYDCNLFFHLNFFCKSEFCFLLEFLLCKVC